MWTADDVKSEMVNISQLLAARRSATGDEDLDGEKQQEKSMVQGCAQRIKLLASISLLEGKMLYEAIQECDLNNDLKKLLRSALDSKLAAGTNAYDDNVVLKPQMLTSISNYMTKNDWKILNNPSSTYLAKTNVIVRRLKLCGVRSLHEQTAKYGVALLLTTLTQLPSYKVIHQMLVEFKQTFHRDLTKVQVPFLRTYPENVEDLPAAITAVAFTEEDPVEPKHLENLVIIAENHVPLRQTSKLMRMDNTSMELPKNKKNQDTNKSMSSTPSPADQQGNNMEGIGAIGQVAMMVLQMAQQQRNQSQGSSETKISITPKKQKELEDGNHKANKDLSAVAASCSGFQPQGRNLALLDAKKEDGTSQPEKAEEKATQKTPAEFEEETFAALVQRSEQKKEVKKDNKHKGKGQQVAKAKAKAKEKGKPAVMKKPSGNFNTYEIPGWRPEDNEVGKNTYTSRHWHGARSFATRVLGWDPEQSKAYAKKFRDKAASIYDKKHPTAVKKARTA